MQVETGLPKWSGRVPPLDLTSVTVCPRETEKRWQKIQPISRKNYDNRIGTDGLPIGMYNYTELFEAKPYRCRKIVSVNEVRGKRFFYQGLREGGPKAKKNLNEFKVGHREN